VTATRIRLLLADVDGTLVTQDKLLTDRAIAAVHHLHDAGVLFSINSGSPPRGMAMLVKPLSLQTPIAALLGSYGLDGWVFRGADWYVPDPEGPHVAREAWTVKFQPKVVSHIGDITDNVAKLVGVSDDQDAVSNAWSAAHDRFGDHITAAASQPYYLDVTHPEANKGSVARYLTRRYRLSAAEIATIGDMPNDVLMFAHSRLSIAMGNADPQVKRAARRITDTNNNEGFAKAVERFILAAAGANRGG
jgi:hydroxymethylpyrimidine pyrophosphatase-like HAD family hydrolase